MTQDIDRNAELAALGRLLVYARDTARLLKSREVEACISVTLEAISKELRSDVEIDLAKLVTSRMTTRNNYQ
jgi:nucleoid DNA-binding protein